jgi:ABC-type polysaccharide/polyol phosphate transport system ATPase subunit
MARIVLNEVGLTFRVRRAQGLTLKEFLVGRMFRRSANPVMEVPALRDVTFSLGCGERLGVLGHNGAGKSTLLKLLAGVYPASCGTRIVEGRISSLFDINLGFETEATGWENIAYRSYLQGETPRSVREKRDGIAEFSELGDFLKMPVRYYSAGMMVRLAFSIATAIDPEILLIDEVLSVGDLSFQTKARKRMSEMMDRAQVMVVVSHDLGALQESCDQILWLDHGRIKMHGKPDEVVAAYKESVQPATVPAEPKETAAEEELPCVATIGPPDEEKSVEEEPPAAQVA